MTKRITILGSTGSIGTKSLEVIDSLPGRFSVQGLSAKSNVPLLCQQAQRYRPPRVAIADRDAVPEIEHRLHPLGIEVLSGPEGLSALAEDADCDLVLNAVVGGVGLVPTLRAIECGRGVALANKESLVMGGNLVVEAVKKHNARLLPIDSEHSAIFQCLHGTSPKQIQRLILTASGGPLWESSDAELESVTPQQALAHPIWSMGPKISVDSATLMNKGLEVIEARWLFDVLPENIEVVVHPESIVHSMVEFVDGSVMAQLGWPDMRLPIQYALTYPQRVTSNNTRLDLTELGHLTFVKPDMDRFVCLSLAYRAAEVGGTLPAVLSAANEVAVDAFLARRLRFPHIVEVIERTMAAHRVVSKPSLEDVIDADGWARQQAAGLAAERRV